jgi:hypothetical protein
MIWWLADATYSDVSVGNASIASEECFQGEEEKPQYNYKGPKVMPTRETPVTILTANTIGTLHTVGASSESYLTLDPTWRW